MLPEQNLCDPLPPDFFREKKLELRFVCRFNDVFAVEHFPH